MEMYELPKFKFSGLKLNKTSNFSRNNFKFLVIVVVISVLLGFTAGSIGGGIFYFKIKDYIEKQNQNQALLPLPSLPSPNSKQETKTQETAKPQNKYLPRTYQEQAIINVVKKVSPAVVSIIISKDLPVYEEYYENPFKEYEEFFGPMPEFKIPKYRKKGTERKEVGGGTGFIISKDGLVLTNKHVVLDEKAVYTVLTNDGKKFSAKVLAKDPLQDLAILKIEQEETKDKNGKTIKKPFPTVVLGDSDKLQIGQTVIAIGNALGEFRNTVSVGVVSGLGRRVTASGGGFVEVLEDVIQTDAAINRGNSGGPLLNLKGEVVGINTAMAVGAQSIGFAIPVNKAKRDIKQIKEIGKIVYPFLGIRYILVNETIKQEKNLKYDYGALIVRGDNGEPAIVPGSSAEKAGLKEGDVILEFNNEKITPDNSLAKIISKYNPGDKVSLKILRNGKIFTVEVILGEREE